MAGMANQRIKHYGDICCQHNDSFSETLSNLRALFSVILAKVPFQSENSRLDQEQKLTSMMTEGTPLEREQLPLASSNSMSPGKNRPLAIEDEQARKKQKTDETKPSILKPLLFSELQSTQRYRERSFSHWPSAHQEFAKALALAGFVSCNVGDRTICIYCNIICQQWDIYSDDPKEMHQLFSPRCPYLSSIPMTNRNLSENLMETNETDARVHFNDYSNATLRKQSFENFSDQFGSRMEELVNAGFFYSTVDSLIKCFSCNYVLLNWENQKDLLAYHTHLSPGCDYVKSKCTAHQNQRESAMSYTTGSRSNGTGNARRASALGRLDETLLNRMVAARLDLPVSQDLLNKNFRLSIIRRVWEDQLRIKHDDFVDDVDVHLACHILQKQIDIINGNKDNIIIPKKKKEEILQRNAAAAQEPAESVNTLPAPAVVPTSTPTTQVEEVKPTMPQKEAGKNENIGPIENPCLVCHKVEKQLACIPCGHLASCLSCGQNIRTCPVCRKDIEAYVRVYL